jgi:hypothetical protein
MRSVLSIIAVGLAVAGSNAKAAEPSPAEVASERVGRFAPLPFATERLYRQPDEGAPWHMTTSWRIGSGRP